MSSPVAAVVEVLAKALVDAPDAVRVNEAPHRGTTVVELTVAPGDTGKVIGRQGRIAEALRTLVAATAHRHGIRATLEIRDPE
ncbi:MAG TPA: KH domain-containing protein [Vicinamibacterales bacterium]